ncbi:MAG: type I glyceraldehyde-3-phosphate dehydrogenase [Flavobacteriales bacterium]|jgi:glyceraldehyde 3-phosphate dehydrogenase|uniref:type I glyceraldehyde-3-phosphate dehydrogenase n=1 Tax=Blattabacterium sp. (Mastotermes darwiniensis) TaxID=39768 RepID=UPI000231DF19|nr:type I glyceraldehyde-3-phosphate dehydrogenase [Blattabacterium sp. (Mastotermes darwiniensis)]AER40845.1 glyceraldehyde 3-phosphate dehydrogenase [Blattabacterium sp. (Mastotermes darwiniensis) str. MADAR]MDR1804692.1 type I glyceraldehyde-3-phosphate dehydrogenase [Flavobacteriales bacterium]
MAIIKIGINGVGRIGKFVLMSSLNRKDIEVVSVNDLVPIEYLAYILKYDSVHGTFKGDIRIENDNILILNGKRIKVTHEKDPKNLKWGDLNVKYVVESTGLFLTKDLASIHLQSGAKKVILSAPPKDDIPMYVMGVNHETLQYDQFIVSNASCTTNCLAPIVKVLNDNFGVLEGLMTTIHASTATQKVVDSASTRDWRSGRSSLTNIIPAYTGAANSVGKIIPSLDGRLTGMAFRVPISDVSVLDLTVRLKNRTTYKNVKHCMKNSSETKLKGILGYTEESVVSTDFIGDERISIFDASSSLMLSSTFIKIVSWYDNEVGYSTKLVDLIHYMDSRYGI